MPFHGGNSYFRCVGYQDIIRIQKLHVLPRGGIQTGIAGGRDTTIGLANHPYTLILSQGRQYLVRLIRRAVIHDDHFQMSVSLVLHGTDTTLNEMLPVVQRDDDADLLLLHEGILLETRNSVKGKGRDGAEKASAGKPAEAEVYLSDRVIRRPQPRGHPNHHHRRGPE